MKIIGHRGAAGLELENTATSIRRALSLSVWSIEIDVRLTKDRQPVICHDGDLTRVSNDSRKISELTLKQIKRVKLLDGSSVLTLPEALKLAGTLPVIIELKDSHSARPVLEVTKDFPNAKVSIASFKLEELALARDLAPNIPLYGLDHTKPFDSIYAAQILKLDGVGLNYWLLNPFTYWHARRHHLKMYVYTVNNKFIAKFLNWFYPEVAICTDHPEWFVRKRPRFGKRRKKKSNARHL